MQETWERQVLSWVGKTPGGGHGHPCQYSWGIPWTEASGGLRSMGSQSQTGLRWCETAHDWLLCVSSEHLSGSVTSAGALSSSDSFAVRLLECWAVPVPAVPHRSLLVGCYVCGQVYMLIPNSASLSPLIRSLLVGCYVCGQVYMLIPNSASLSPLIPRW